MNVRRVVWSAMLALALAGMVSAGCGERGTRAPQKPKGDASTVAPPSGATSAPAPSTPQPRGPSGDGAAPPSSSAPAPRTHEPPQVAVVPPSSAPSPPMRKPTDATVAPMPAPGSEGDLPKFGEYVYVEELPEPVKRVQPVMPSDAASRGLEGFVLVQALVGREGRVLRTQVTKSVPGLDDAAVAAVRQWEFEPARSNNRPVAVWVAVPVRFPPR